MDTNQLNPDSISRETIGPSGFETSVVTIHLASPGVGAAAGFKVGMDASLLC